MSEVWRVFTLSLEPQGGCALRVCVCVMRRKTEVWLAQAWALGAARAGACCTALVTPAVPAAQNLDKKLAEFGFWSQG